jgi:hypothetical protein
VNEIKKLNIIENLTRDFFRSDGKLNEIVIGRKNKRELRTKNIFENIWVTTFTQHQYFINNYTSSVFWVNKLYGHQEPPSDWSFLESFHHH